MFTQEWRKAMAAKKFAPGALAVALAVAIGGALGAEVPAGTVISKDNFDKIRNDTFEGKTIGSMIPERMEWLIKSHGLTMKIKHSEKIEMDPKYVEATRKYHKDVVFDPKTRDIKGWKAGMPFPPETIDINDPHAGDKAIWNIRAATYGHILDIKELAFLFLDGKTGLERVQRWQSQRVYLEGRLDGGPLVLGDGTVQQKTTLFAVSPQDIRGLGTFSVRYNDALKPDDTWAYLKSVRRTRRLSGGAWMDPIGGTDQLYDDWDIWDAAPPKYKSIKLLGKRTVFVICHTKPIGVDVSKRGAKEEFPLIDLDNAPYWWPKNVEWEPREVYVIEGITNDEHPYGKKLIYMEVTFPRVYLGEMFDKKGDFWKFMIFQNRPAVGDDGYKSVIPVSGHVIDFKRYHSTTWVSNMGSNPKGVKPDDISLGQLEAVAR